MAHHLLKLELAAAARAAGAHCEMEVRGPEGVWRADVMASDPGGSWRVALEAQLSPITPDAIAARTERMRVNDVRSVWFSDRLRSPWLGLVPSVRLVTDESGGLAVAEGLARFAGGFWEAGPRVPLAEFLGWVFADRVVPHHRIVQRTRHSPDPLFTVWTAPQYVRAEAAYREERDHGKQERWETGRQHAASDPFRPVVE
jgi:competence protein CoiA